MSKKRSRSGQQGRSERVAAMRQAEQRREKGQRLVIFGVAGAVIAALVGFTAWAVIGQQARQPGPGEKPKVNAEGRTDPPPWSLPADPVPVAKAAGLRVAPMEGTAKHFHAHLDVLVDGKPIPVPADIGIHPSGNAMSELHTHDQRGVLHVEAPTADRRYTLGQVFAQWDVRLDAANLGGLKAEGAKTLKAYVNGKRFKGNPADIELLKHRQVALVYGDDDAEVDVPASYKFQPGE